MASCTIPPLAIDIDIETGFLEAIQSKRNLIIEQTLTQLTEVLTAASP